ncbi:septum formation family protein [Ruania alkalisoli]|uniref:Septum formation family protein n=1 Tax=Ruania alkalisoli TaxID=2779775 RepID=A0A7M1SUH9_9MICO|nr:septum formation family protein [Ruania alkalisoli]QOR70273.1 septum formation family protein [Ruania alkalisoli]
MSTPDPSAPRRDRQRGDGRRLAPARGRHAGSWAGFGQSPGADPSERSPAADRRSTTSVPMIAAVAVGLALVLIVGTLGFRALFQDDPTPTPPATDPASATPTPTGEPPTPTTSPGAVSEFDLTVGQCLDGYELGDPEMPLADCADPHRFEVFAQDESAEEDYPGEGEMTTAADEFCRESLLAELPEDLDTTPVVYRTIAPSPETWETGDRTLTCIAGVDEGYTMTGSFTRGDEVVVAGS